MKSKIAVLIILPILIAFLYGFTLRYGFFQDDFYSLTKIQDSVINWFVPGQEIYYRPLSMRVYFWLMQAIFGLNSAAYHIVALILHFLNALLAGKIATKLSRNQSIGLIVSFLYGVSSLHFVSLMWIAEIGLLMGITFYLIAINSHLNHQRRLTLILFILGLLTHEYLITLPVMLLLIDWYQRNVIASAAKQSRWGSPRSDMTSDLAMTIKKNSLLIIITIVYLFLRLLIFPLPATGSYSLTLGKPTLKALFWYGIWSLNIPENFKDQLEPGLKLNQTFLYDFIPLSLTSLITLIIIIIMFAAIPLAVYIHSPAAKRKIINQHLIFCIGWILITLSIPLITPIHLYPMYASLAFIGIAYGISQLIYFAYKRPQLIMSLVIMGWIITSWQSTRFMARIHWTVQEATRVSDAYRKLSQTYTSFPPNSIILINQDYQIQQALYGDFGLQVLFKDPTLKTNYGPVDSILPPECTINTATCLANHQIYHLP